MQRKAKLTRGLAFGGVLVALVAALLGGGRATAEAGPPEDAVLDWNLHAISALSNAATAAVPGAGQPPPVASQHLAMVQGAVYDAVNMIDGGHEPYLDGLPSASANASKPAAVATAAHHVLVGLGIAPVPALPPATKTWLDAAYGTYLAGLPNEGKQDGIDAGAAAAAAMLAERTGDGRYVPFSFTCGEDPGDWRPTSTVPPGGPPPLTCTPLGASDPFAWVAKVEPFTLKSTSQFRTKGPHALTSRQYTKEYNEVKGLGGNGTTTLHARTQAQTDMAWFFTVNPVPMYSASFRAIAQAEGLSLVEEARLFALLGLSGADAFINCWDDKEHYGFWRPITAIRTGDNDTNTKTVGDTGWTSLIAAPPYPDHPSGYNCITGSYMQTGKAFFGNRTSFMLNATPNVGTPPVPTPMMRTYDRFTDVPEDTIVARMYQGIHFRTPDAQGAKLGKKVANWVEEHELEPVDDDDDDDDDEDDD